jgi:soluble lytic murein transglycosylase
VLLAPVLLALALPVHAADASKRFAAITAYEEGRFADVIAQIPDSSDAELALLRARAAAELSRYGEALDWLGDTAKFPAEVTADLTQQRRTWAARAGRCAELGPVPASDPGHLYAYCSIVARDFATALELTKSAKDLEGRVVQLSALVGLDDLVRARPLAHTLHVESPNHRDAELFARVLRDSDGKITLSNDETLKRAEGLIKGRRIDDALRELDALPEPKDKATRARYHHLRGEALFRMRTRYPDAAKAYERAAALKGESEAHDAFHAVRSLSRAGQDELAIKRYRAYAKAYPKSSFAGDAVYLAAWLGSRLRTKGAKDELAKFATSKHAKEAPGLRHDAHWDLAWDAILREDGRTAERWLSAYASDADKPLDQGRAAYWRGRAALLRKDDKEAAAHFLKAIESDLLGYYAQMAAVRLRELQVELPSPFTGTAAGLERPTHAVPPGVVFYARLGLMDDAARLAEPWVKALPTRADKVAAWLAAGNVAKAYAAAEPMLPEVLVTPPEGPSRWLWEAVLPRPYAQVVEAETARLGLDADELYAHMQVESRYQPRVVSGADALGLLQLLPGTAKTVAKGMGLTIERNDIFVPSINVALASKYLAGLLAEHRGQLPLAIAAYNAGSSRVKGWGEHKPLDQWVEEIPIEQTRNYVRRVLSAWSRYRALRNPAEPWTLPLPSHVGTRTD